MYICISHSNALMCFMSSGRITFTVVSDPEDQGTDCVDLGTAEMDLNEVC